MLAGKTIAITRSQEDSEEFIELMSKNNANTISLPTIELVSKGEKIVDEILKSIELHQPDYSVFMSSKAVKLLFDTAKKLSKDKELQLGLANTIIVAVGPKTKTALEEEGLKVAHMPDRYSSVGVGEIFTQINSFGKKVIIPRSVASTPFLKNLLEKIGLEVIEIYLYDVKPFNDPSKWNEFTKLLKENKIDGIIFTSASSVRAFFEIMLNTFDKKNLLNYTFKTKIVAIGPFTSAELKKFDVENTIAEVHTVAGAFDTIKNIFSLAPPI